MYFGFGVEGDEDENGEEGVMGEQTSE